MQADDPAQLLSSLSLQNTAALLCYTIRDSYNHSKFPLCVSAGKNMFHEEEEENPQQNTSHISNEHRTADRLL